MFLKSARVFNVKGLPAQFDADELVQHTEMPEGSTITLSYGFAPIPNIGESSVKFDGEMAGTCWGIGVQFVVDEKVVPAFALQRLTDKRVREIEKDEARYVGRKEYQTLRDDIHIGLLPKTPFKRTSFPVFLIQKGTEQMIIVGASKFHAGLVISTLIKTYSSIATTTIHFDDFTQGLTRRLLNTIEENTGLHDDGSPTLAPFTPVGKILLSKKHQRVRMKIDEVENDQLLSLLGALWEVIELALKFGDEKSQDQFTIDRDFQFKSIQWADRIATEADGDGGDYYHNWRTTAFIRCTAIIEWVATFKSMLFQADAVEEDEV